MAALNVLIVGCGYVGTALGKKLAQRGDEVVGVCPTNESNSELEKAGIRPVVADITDSGSMRKILPFFDAVVDCVSSRRQGEAAYREVYLKGTLNLLSWARQSPRKFVVFTSSTTVYPQSDGEWVDETSLTNPLHKSGRIILEAEKLFLHADPPAVILRLAGIYGPGRHVILDKLRGGTTVLPGNGQHYVNMVHRDDIVQVIIAALDRKPAGEIINVADDEPVLQVEYARWLCEQLRLPMVKFDPEAERKFKGGMRKGFQPNRRVRNLKMKSALGVQLKFPNFREGLKPLLTTG